MALTNQIPRALVFIAALYFTINQTSALKKSPLKVGAFNIRAFGDNKLSDEDRAEKLKTLVRKYDVLVILEVRDEDLTACNTLLNILGTRWWNFVVSEPKGRTHYKERVAVFYRFKNANIMGEYNFDDSVSDHFERDPFGVEIEYYSVKGERNVRVVLLAVHTQPKRNFEELSALPEVMGDAWIKFPESSGVIALGDLNADCSYLNNRQRATIPLFNDPRFQSLIGEEADTTVSKTNCAYDRIVLEAGEDVIADRAEVIKFDKLFGLDTEAALKISDHYPIIFRLN